MLIRSVGIFVVLAGMAVGAQASNLDINLGSNSAAASYSTDFGGSGLEGTVGYLHHTDWADIANAGLLVNGSSNPAGSPFTFGAGAKVFFVSPKQVSGDGTVLGLGGQFKYRLPDYNRFSIGGELYGAPPILSFGNADRFLEYGVNAGYDVANNTELYVGYRHISGAFGGGTTVTLDSNIVVGVNVSF